MGSRAVGKAGFAGQPGYSYGIKQNIEKLMSVPLLFTEEFEVVTMIESVTERDGWVGLSSVPALIASEPWLDWHIFN